MCNSYSQFWLCGVHTSSIIFEQHKSEFEYQIELIKRGNSIDHFGNLGIEITRKFHAIVFGYLSDDLYLSSYAYVYAEKIPI